MSGVGLFVRSCGQPASQLALLLSFVEAARVRNVQTCLSRSAANAHARNEIESLAREAGNTLASVRPPVHRTQWVNKNV